MQISIHSDDLSGRTATVTFSVNHLNWETLQRKITQFVEALQSTKLDEYGRLMEDMEKSQADIMKDVQV